MEWFLGFLLLISLVIDGALYILYRGGFIRFSAQGKTLEESVKNLSKKVGEIAETQKTLESNHAYDCSTLAQSLEQAENRIAQLTESHTELDEEMTRLFNERAVPTIITPEREPVRVNKGGRPRKVG